MLFRLLVLALGKTESVSYTQSTKCGSYGKKYKMWLTRQGLGSWGCLKAPWDTNCIKSLQGKLQAFVKVFPGKTPSHPKTAWNCCSQIHLGDRMVTKLLLGTPSSSWWKCWNEAISDWRTPSIPIRGWDHRTTEYPMLEGTHKGHWSPASGPGLLLKFQLMFLTQSHKNF